MSVKAYFLKNSGVRFFVFAFIGAATLSRELALEHYARGNPLLIIAAYVSIALAVTFLAIFVFGAPARWTKKEHDEMFEDCKYMKKHGFVLDFSFSDMHFDLKNKAVYIPEKDLKLKFDEISDFNACYVPGSSGEIFAIGAGGNLLRRGGYKAFVGITFTTNRYDLPNVTLDRNYSDVNQRATQLDMVVSDILRGKLSADDVSRLPRWMADTTDQWRRAYAAA